MPPKAACLLIHGYCGAPTELAPFAQHLHWLGYTISYVDWSNLNRNTSPQDLWQEWYACVEAGYLSLTESTDQVVLIGHSTGAILALLLATAYPTRGIVCFSPISHLQTWQSLVVRLFAGIHRFYSRARWLNGGLEIGMANSSFLTIDTLLALDDLLKVTPECLSNIQVPVLIFKGGKDFAIPKNSAVRLSQYLSSTTTRSILIPNAGHLLMDPEFTEEVWDPAAAFIQKVTQEDSHSAAD